MRQQRLCEIFGFDDQCATKDLHPPYTFADKSKALNGPRPNRPGSSLRQKRICNNSRCTHKLSFLSLPTSVRHQIYFQAGLIHDQNLYLQKDYESQKTYQDNIQHQTILDYQTTLSLLLTSHAIHEEILSIEYSTNTFYVKYHWTGGLAPIRHLAPKALATLTKLVIIMNKTSCDSSGCCRSGPDTHPYSMRNCGSCKLPDSKPFGIPEAQQAVTEWHVTAKYLSTYIVPSQLNFVFICDVQDLETARLVLNPFYNIKKLSSCQIRLARDLRFKSLAEEASLAATRLAPFRHHPFPFLKLLPELQLAILSFTDLVAPHCEIEVGMDGKYRARNALPDCWPGDPRYDHAIGFLYCFRKENICLCRRQHSSSSNCRCWTAPIYIFLVSKSVREMATETFFTRNRFVIMPPGWGNGKPAPLTFDQFPPSIFFQRMLRHNTLHYLRRIDIPMPAYRAIYQQPTELAFTDWQKTVDKIFETKSHFSGMTVAIFMGYSAVLTQPERPGSHYYRFCDTLAKFGLNRCYVHTVQHFPWQPEGEYYTYHSTTDDLKSRALVMEEMLEKVVMGKKYSTNHDLLNSSGVFQLEWVSAADSDAFERTFR